MFVCFEMVEYSEFLLVDIAAVDNFDFDIIGRVPQNSNEIIISKYVADNIIKNGISLNNNYNIYLPKS